MVLIQSHNWMFETNSTFLLIFLFPLKPEWRPEEKFAQVYAMHSSRAHTSSPYRPCSRLCLVPTWLLLFSLPLTHWWERCPCLGCLEVARGIQALCSYGLSPALWASPRAQLPPDFLSTLNWEEVQPLLTRAEHSSCEVPPTSAFWLWWLGIFNLIYLFPLFKTKQFLAHWRGKKKKKPNVLCLSKAALYPRLHFRT